MIYATCLNESSHTINEDFELSLLIENCELQYMIIQEANFSDKIKHIKEMLHNILKWIRKKISEFKMKLFNKKKPKPTKTYKDNYHYEIYELSSKYNEIAFLLSTDNIKKTLGKEEFDINVFTKETVDYITESETDGQINNIKVDDIIQTVPSFHSETTTIRITKIEEYLKKLMNIIDEDYIKFESNINSLVDSMKDLDDKQMSRLTSIVNVYITVALKMKQTVLEGIRITTEHNNRVYKYCFEGKPMPEE